MIQDFSEHIQAILRTIPELPGVYHYYGKDKNLLYIGKAKNLKNRVTSYFSNFSQHTGKTRVLVKQIEDIQYIITNNELEALLLENSLIKKHQPKYNINLKDDKTFPYIIIKKEHFPRVFHTRQPDEHQAEVFGPYANVYAMHIVLDLIKQMFKLRTCSLPLTPKNIERHKFKVCLEYHIGNCKGPCEGLQSEYDYNESINGIRNILKGNLKDLERLLRENMMRHAEAYQFEEAQEIKEKLEHLEKFRSKSLVVNNDMEDMEIYAIQSNPNTAYVTFFRVMDGAIIQAFTRELSKKLDESDTELLEFAILQIREKLKSNTKTIVTPFEVNLPLQGVKFVVPKLGDKKKLLEMAEKNNDFYVKDKLRQIAIKDPESHTNRILEQMKKDLRLKELPRHIECFDNSNFQGDYAVSACVVFKDAKPSKRDYRIFNVKTVVGPDDFATMEEVIYRRYKRMLEEEQALPQLIVIDGGKGQLGAAINSLRKLDLMGKIAIIGIAKRLEEIYYPGDSLPLYIDKKSESLKIIQQLRDEAHRFGITNYRKRHEKGLIKTELSEIKGIGEKTSEALLMHFRSVARIKEASEAEIAEVIGKAKAKIVFLHFHPNNTI